MRQIRWTTVASSQLVAAVRRIAEDRPEAAVKAARTVMTRVDGLMTFPGIGRPGEVDGTRELVVPPYGVVYRYTEEIVEILFVWHGAQDWR